MKNITAMMITLAMLLSMTACNDGTNTPANTTAETTEVTASAEVTTTVMGESDITKLLNGYTVYEVTTESVMYTMNEDDPDNSYDVRKLEYHVPFSEFQERWENGELFSEKIALSFTDLNRFTLLVDIRTDDMDLLSEITHIIYENCIIECSTPLEYSERWFTVDATDEIIALKGNYDTDGYLISKNGYINIPTLRNEGDNKSELYFYVHEGVLKYRYTNVLFSYAVSLGAELRNDYNSEDDLYAEYGKIILDNGIPKMEMTDRITISEWYQSDDFPYAKIRDEYGFSTLREMANRFSGTNGYQEFIEIYEEMERG